MKKEIQKYIKEIAEYYKVSQKEIQQSICAIKKRKKEVEKMIDKQIRELYELGLINDKREEDKLLRFAIRHKITNLYRAVLTRNIVLGLTSEFPHDPEPDPRFQ